MSNSRQWRARDYEEDDEKEYSEEPSSQQGSSVQQNAPASSGISKASQDRSSVGPPPSYDGDRRPGQWEDYRIRARLWLKTPTFLKLPEVQGCFNSFRVGPSIR